MNAVDYAAANKNARNADKAKAGWYSFAAYEKHRRNGENWQGSNIVVIDADAKHGEVESAEYRGASREQSAD